ncbi:hypothetical protein [Cobetia sp. Dlab-2-U]|uniref:hypothetical protein n=1 Tax=Cobetia sp. Dlab-2-U TaxID=2954489 RepID=UPI002097E806|nr:hypothetical protein [Cobetia sp. Dlab-2-U]MCO7233715.1 hypothetical protein [Cobetia sp. Dlab-2-AX]MCO7237112.1 hypothetical protein [Cobetia sp. Dlab-2-U]
MKQVMKASIHLIHAPSWCLAGKACTVRAILGSVVSKIQALSSSHAVFCRGAFLSHGYQVAWLPFAPRCPRHDREVAPAKYTGNSTFVSYLKFWRICCSDLVMRLGELASLPAFHALLHEERP